MSLKIVQICLHYWQGVANGFTVTQLAPANQRCQEKPGESGRIQENPVDQDVPTPKPWILPGKSWKICRQLRPLSRLRLPCSTCTAPGAAALGGPLRAPARGSRAARSQRRWVRNDPAVAGSGGVDGGFVGEMAGGWWWNGWLIVG